MSKPSTGELTCLCGAEGLALLDTGFAEEVQNQQHERQNRLAADDRQIDGLDPEAHQKRAQRKLAKYPGQGQQHAAKENVADAQVLV